ncbi:hypothetical protein Ocin01_17249, partial [Orchesella cincta]
MHGQNFVCNPVIELVRDDYQLLDSNWFCLQCKMLANETP